MAILGRRLLVETLAYQRPLWRRVMQRGPRRAAPVATTFLLACLAVSALWVMPGPGHRLASRCCAYRGWQSSPGDAMRLVGSALLLRHPYEVLWTVAATVLVTGPFEAYVGGQRLLAVGTLGHVVPTVAVAAAGLSGNQRLGGGGLDVGASAVVVAAAAGLVVRSRSAPLAACVAAAQFVDVVVGTPLSSIEHLGALSVGAVATLALSRNHPRGVRQRAAVSHRDPLTGLSRSAAYNRQGRPDRRDGRPGVPSDCWKDR